MHQACFYTVRSIDQMACMIFPEISGVDLLGVGWRGGFYSLKLPAMTDMVSFYPVGIITNFTTFINLLRNFYAFKHFTCILVGPSLQIPAL